MEEAGLSDRARLAPGGLSEADGVSAAQAFLAERSAENVLAEPPTAVCAFNDQCAIGFLQTVRDAGVRVPGEVSLIGYDDSRLAHASWTRLTTIGQDTATLAEGAVTRALARIRPADRTATDRAVANRTATDRSPTEPLLVPPSLVIRNTTGRPGARSAVPDPRRL